MASYGAIQRPSATPRSVTTVDSSDLRDSTTGTNWNDFNRAEFKLACPFEIPSSPEAAALRIIRNLGHFAAVPSSNIIHKILDKRLVLPVIVVATMVELVLTHAGLHLLLTLAGSLPVVLVHAVLWVIEDFSVEEESYGRRGGDGPSGELLPLVQESSVMV
ncbi:hypothetical protein GH714_010998 [Hevea brasiliensis]|uniref:PRA1 family protein n=1 Tax=Hevea brasiliensis TaxID=3981 RepID=A0A6A6LIZ9_HEVBR|nr:hypothetical protein GH714_010998 [Hevea brasiliensis]